MSDAGFVKGFTHCGHFARGQEAAGCAKIRLQNVVRIMDQAFPESVEAAESLSTGNQDIHFSSQPRRTFEIVPSKRTSLERLGGGEPRRIIPNRAGYVRRPVDHDFETRAAGGEYSGAGLHVIHEV